MHEKACGVNTPLTLSSLGHEGREIGGTSEVGRET